jgi:uncharacterized protein (TIGR00730 family)
MRVTVFGSATSKPNDAEYQLAESLGQALAQAGHSVITGGYFGTMEAVSKGAAAVENADVIGVICSPMFPSRPVGNNYLTTKIDMPTLPQRLDKLIENVDAFIALPGRIGTLNELVLVWNNACIRQMFNQPNAPIVVFRQPWATLVDAIAESLQLTETQKSLVSIVNTVEEALALLP